MGRVLPALFLLLIVGCSRYARVEATHDFGGELDVYAVSGVVLELDHTEFSLGGGAQFDRVGRATPVLETGVSATIGRVYVFWFLYLVDPRDPEFSGYGGIEVRR